MCADSRPSRPRGPWQGVRPVLHLLSAARMGRCSCPVAPVAVARCLLNVFTFLFYLAAVFDLVLCAVVCACAANNNLMANADTHRRYRYPAGDATREHKEGFRCSVTVRDAAAPAAHWEPCRPHSLSGLGGAAAASERAPEPWIRVAPRSPQPRHAVVGRATRWAAPPTTRAPAVTYPRLRMVAWGAAKATSRR